MTIKGSFLVRLFYHSVITLIAGTMHFGFLFFPARSHFNMRLVHQHWPSQLPECVLWSHGSIHENCSCGVVLHLFTKYQCVCMCGGTYRSVQPSKSLLFISKYFGLLVMDMSNAILLLQGVYLRRIAQDGLKNTPFFNCGTQCLSKAYLTVGTEHTQVACPTACFAASNCIAFVCNCQRKTSLLRGEQVNGESSLPVCSGRAAVLRQIPADANHCLETCYTRSWITCLLSFPFFPFFLLDLWVPPPSP